MKVYASAILLLAASMAHAASTPVANDQKKIVIDEQLRLAAGFASRSYFDLAAKEYGEILRRFPGDPLAAEASMRLGETLTRLGEHDKALAAFKDFFDRFPTSKLADSARISQAAAHAATKRPEEIQKAVDILTPLARAASIPEPLRESAACGLARILASRGELDKAEPFYKELSLLDPEMEGRPHRAYGALGMAEILTAKGDSAAAVELLNKLSTKTKIPKEVQLAAMVQSAGLLDKAGRFAEAADAYGRAALQFSDSTQGMESKLMRLSCLLKAGANSGVAQEVDATLKAGADAGPLKEKLLCFKAAALRAQGFHAAALPIYTEILKTTSDDPLYRIAAIQAAQCQSAIKKTPEAVQFVMKKLADPRLRDADRHAMAADLSVKLEDQGAMANVWRETLKRVSDTSVKTKASLELGGCLERVGTLPQAMEAYSTAMDSANLDVATSAGLGMARCQIASGTPGKAVETLDALLKKIPPADVKRAVGVRLAKAESLIRADRFAEARPDLAAAAGSTTDPLEKAKANYYLGHLEFREKAWAAAAEHFTAAAQVKELPADTRAQAKLYLGFADLEAGRKAKAMESLKSSAADKIFLESLGDPELSRLAWALASESVKTAAGCLAALAARPEADPHLRQKAFLGLADAAEGDGDLETSIRHCKSVAPLDPQSRESCQAYTKMGKAMAAKGAKDEAVLMFEKCLAMPADEGAAHSARFELAKILSERPASIERANEYAVSVFVLTDNPKLAADAMLLSVKLCLSLGKTDMASRTWNELSGRFPAAVESSDGKALSAAISKIRITQPTPPSP